MAGRTAFVAIVVTIALGAPAAATNLLEYRAADSGAAGRIFTVAGTGDTFGWCKGAAGIAQVDPQDVAVLPAGGFLIASDSQVCRVTPKGRISAVAGTGTFGQSGDGGPATRARLRLPEAVAVLPSGGFLIADGTRVRRVDASGIITTVAGTGKFGFSGDGGPATRAELVAEDLAVLPDGGFLIADGTRVRRVAPDGVISTVAGTGEYEYSGDGPATTTNLVPEALASLPDGGFLIADGYNRRVFRVDPTGGVSTIAGTGARGFSGDGGPATAARVNPRDVIALPGGGFLIADGHRVRRVAADGIITTIAGGGTGTYFPGYLNGDGGSATAARLEASGVALLPDQGLLISDYGAVRLVTGPSSELLALAFQPPNHDRVRGSSYTTRVATSRAARVAIDVSRRRSLVAREVVTTGGGWTRARVRGGFRPAIYTVTAEASEGTATAIQIRLAALGGTLLDRWAIEIAGGDSRTRIAGTRRGPVATPADPEETISRTRRCRRFSRARVDCEIRESDIGPSPPFTCRYVERIVLRRDAQIYERSYRCPRRGTFQRDPQHWFGSARPVDLMDLE